MSEYVCCKSDCATCWWKRSEGWLMMWRGRSYRVTVGMVCPICGTELLAEGKTRDLKAAAAQAQQETAAATADAACVARVREALDALEGGCPAYPENVKRNRNRVTRAIRAALDPQHTDDNAKETT